MTKLKLMLPLIVALASLALAGCHKTENSTAAGTKYTCEMHPEVVQDKPGECPKCHMKLIVKK